MKLVVMIPAYNEGDTIGSVIRDIPRHIPGVDDVQVLVIDDGSTDNTIEQARLAGATKVISHRKNKGLATAFKHGLEGALIMGADIIVNTDADGQYLGIEIPHLINPILYNKADIVLGNRQIKDLKYMPFPKKIGNRLSSWVVRRVSGLPVTDAQTGFRAFSREAALRLNVISHFTYTQETLVQAANKKLVYHEVPITSKQGPERKSRLFGSIWGYAKRSGATIIRTYRDYKPLKVFGMLGSIIILIGLLVGSRVLLNYLQTGAVSPYIPSAILSTVILIVGFQVIVFGFLADMISNQKRLIEDIIYKIKKKNI